MLFLSSKIVIPTDLGRLIVNCHPIHLRRIVSECKKNNQMLK